MYFFLWFSSFVSVSSIRGQPNDVSVTKLASLARAVPVRARGPTIMISSTTYIYLFMLARASLAAGLIRQPTPIKRSVRLSVKIIVIRCK